ncbi:MAG: class I SAM-dependent methyltransferase [Terriglobales bacterium]
MDHEALKEVVNSTMSTPKLYVVSMVRNEADLYSTFLIQLSCLFDKIFLVDHQSTDGSREIADCFINSGANIEVFSFKHRGYHQSEISDMLARRAFKEGADWCFFLDADEFIDVGDRNVLRGLVGSFGHDVMNLRWANLIPADPGTFTSFDTGQPFYWDGRLSRYGKIAIAASFAATHPNFHVHQGNHAVSGSRGQAPASMRDGCRLLHVPIRSLDRLRYKLAAGVQAYRAKTASNSSEGFHWFELYDRLERGAVAKDWINGVIAQYGEPLASVEPVDPVASNWEVVRIPAAFIPDAPAGVAASLPETVAADTRESWEAKPIDESLVRACLAGSDIVLRPQPMFGDGSPYEGGFDRLPPEQGGLSNIFDDHQLADALSSAFSPIKTVVPSAWVDHAPLLFVLFTLLRPRRYVEIGTHWGMSYFAACQAADHLGIGTQCVAIDAWFGDEHAGFYDRNVFEQFSAILKATYPHQLYIRSLFDDAAQCFDDGSIDLLHIDGLHTYEAVKSDYERWRPKLSNRAVVMFHDTNVYEKDFGVWRLWDELKEKYPHFHAPHCHGLGILYVGDEPSAFAVSLQRLMEDKGLTTLVITFLAKIGAMSAERTQLSNQLQESRAEQERLAVTLNVMHGSTSWKLTRPVRMTGRLLRSVRAKVLALGIPFGYPSGESNATRCTTRE